MALLMKTNSKEKDYIACWYFLLLETVTSCLYVHVHLLKCWKTRLGDRHFNCKQVSDVYCNFFDQLNDYTDKPVG